MTALIIHDACDVCPDRELVEAAPPREICKASPTHDFDCARFFAAYDLEELAKGVADDLAHHCRHVEAEERKSLAEAIADSIDNAVFAIGAKFDTAAFLKLAGVAA